MTLAMSLTVFLWCPVWHETVRPSHFYRAMLCIRGTSHGRVSVRPSVCPSQVGVLLKRLNVGSHKQQKNDSPGTLVFWCQRPPRNSTGITSCRGAKCRWGGSKSATFDWAICRKRCKIYAWFLLKPNRKSYALYRMAALPMTLIAP